MGALGELIERIKVSGGAPEAKERLKRSAETVEEIWDEIEKAVSRIRVVPGKTRVYQDGLPVCGREREMVRELAAAGSRNHKLLLRLEAEGAILMGTESPELLMEEYQLAKATLHSSASAIERRRHEQWGEILLQKRDRFIASRIGSTLQSGETGILLMGMLHSVPRYLARDIQIDYPVKAR